MSITAFMTLVGCLAMLGSWAFVGHRIKLSQHGVSQQVRLLRNFFLFMGLFCLCIFAPQFALSLDPAKFPMAMAWGYIIGHGFLYVGLIQVLRLMFSMVPRLANKQKYAITAGIIIMLLITVLNIITMVFGTQPQYDYERHVTLFNVAPVVGALIGIFATASVFPAAILMIINGIHNPPARLRSFLLGGGLFVIMTAGPLHDVSKTWQLYMVADIVSIVGLVIVAAGIMYRFEERVVPARPAVAASAYTA